MSATTPWATSTFVDELGGIDLRHTHDPFHGVAHPIHGVAQLRETPAGECISVTELVAVPEASSLLASGSLLAIVAMSLLPRARRWIAARF